MRKYVTLEVSEINDVNFEEVLQTSADTCILSVDGSKTMIKYEGDMPPSIVALNTKSEEYTHEQILELLATSEWQEEHTPPSETVDG